MTTATLVENRPHSQTQKGGTPPGPTGGANASLKKELRSKPYDEQVQMVTPDQSAPKGATETPTSGQTNVASTPSTDAAPKTDAGAAPEKSEGQLMREAVAANALEWSGKEFMSDAEINAIRTGDHDGDGKPDPGVTPMPNYTTCIDFAGKMMRESVREVYANDPKKAAQTAQMHGQVKADWEKGVGARIQAASWQKNVARLDKAIAGIEESKAKMVKQIEELRQPQKEGESELAMKGRHMRADSLEKQGLPNYDKQIASQKKVRDGFQIKVDKFNAEATEIDAKNTAMIIAADGLTNGRPMEGEYVILSAPPKGAVGAVTKVALPGGAFKHIAIFMGVTQEDDGSGFETWKTIDGGGKSGKTTMLFVRKADRGVFPAYQGAPKPDANSAPSSQLAGWIDMDEMIKMRDAKKAGGGK